MVGRGTGQNRRPIDPRLRMMPCAGHKSKKQLGSYSDLSRAMLDVELVEENAVSLQGILQDLLVGENFNVKVQLYVEAKEPQTIRGLLETGVLCVRLHCRGQIAYDE